MLLLHVLPESSCLIVVSFTISAIVIAGDRLGGDMPADIIRSTCTAQAVCRVSGLTAFAKPKPALSENVQVRSL